MWPYLKPKTRIFRIALLTIILLTILIPQAMTAYLLSFVALLKVFTFQFNIHTIKDLTQHLLCDWKELNTYEEYEIMKSYAANGRRFSLIYSAIIIFMSMSLIPHTLDIILPLNESRPVLPPYRGYYFVDIREHFFQIFWHAIVAWEIVIAGIIAHDCLFVTYVEHVCSKFAITGFHYEHLFHDCKNKVEIVSSINSDDTTYSKRVAFLVRKHREALEYAQLLEDTFTIPFAMQIFIVTVGMSITLLQMKVLIDQLFVDWNELETPEEYEIMERYAKNSRRYSLGYSLYYYFGVYVFISLSLIPQVLDVVLPLNESRPILPIYPGYYFVDERKYFFYIFSHAIMAWEIAVTVILSHDCMLLTYIEHICSIFTLVGYNSLWYETSPKSQRMLLFIMRKSFQPIFLSASKMYIFSMENFTMMKIFIDQLFLDWNELETPEEYEIMKKYAKNGRRYFLGYFVLLCSSLYRKKIAFIVHVHRKALRYAQLLEDTFSVYKMVHVCTMDGNILESMRYTLYIIGELIHLFFLSFEGQKLIDHSLQIRDKM
ncbi:hypothetical protein ALC60_04513 [Trachymyrmex zeteki]|uniref:Odorant receptor n=1 Tax=Mycetomoellerius zeteki TaxID=64791 RepID=A0A151X7T1_9HYME|nr:hypothetical protein ALC60_04513 [Trachymyrmex zeteki]